VVFKILMNTPIKERLFAHIAKNDTGKGFSEEAFAELGRLVEAIRAETVYPAPMDTLRHVEGRWETLFAHFGARHSAGKPKVHDSTLKVQSFNAFPPVPVRIERLCQEISEHGNGYNNVVNFTAADGVTRGVIVVHGRFTGEPDNRQRFSVDFYRVELRPGEGANEAGLRKALGFAASEPLSEDLKPLRFHSDVVYLDADTRINIGSLGGLYVLRRLDEEPVSLRL
jgi:hypothetical protein